MRTALGKDIRRFLRVLLTIAICSATGFHKLRQLAADEQLGVTKRYGTLSVTDYRAYVGSAIEAQWRPIAKLEDTRICKMVFVIELNGQVTHLSVEETSGNQAFDKAALLLIRKSSPFKPPSVAMAHPTRIRMHLKFIGNR